MISLLNKTVRIRSVWVIIKKHPKFYCKAEESSQDTGGAGLKGGIIRL